MTLAVAGTEVAVILVEQAGRRIQDQLSQPHCRALDCSELARQFGGGGHKAAAGGFTSAPWPEAQTHGA